MGAGKTSRDCDPASGDVVEVILKGTESGLTGIKQFLQGQKLVMENK